MRDLQSGTEYLWSRTKFINRKFAMQEMFQDYEDGDDWHVPDEKDPFTESPDAETLIGCVEVSMQSLGYMVSKSSLSPTPYNLTLFFLKFFPHAVILEVKLKERFITTSPACLPYFVSLSRCPNSREKIRAVLTSTV